MKMFDAVMKRLPWVWGGAGAESFPQSKAWPWAVFGDRPPGADVSEPYRQHAAVYAGVSAISRDAAGIQWELFQKSGTRRDAPIEGHGISEMLAKPNATMHGNQLMAGTVISYVLFGEAFWYYPGVRVMSNGVYGMETLRPVSGELTLLDPRAVGHRISEDGKAVQWWLQQGETRMPLDPDEFTHFKAFNPYCHERGQSRLAAAMMEILSDAQAAQWSLSYFKRGATPSGMLSPSVGAMLTKDQRADMLRTFNDRHGGTKRGVGILPAGWTFQDFGVNHHDMDFPLLRNWSREQILAVLGVPPFMAGVLENANYANAREQERLYWRHNIKPLLEGFQCTFNYDLLPKLGISGLELWPKWEAVASLIDDHESKSTIAARYWQMGVPFQEINDRLELGFDPTKVASAQTGFMPMNVVPVDLSVEQSKAELDAIKNPPPPPPAAPMAPAAEPESDDDAPQETTRGMTMNEGARAVMWKVLMARTTDLERGFLRRWRKLTQDWYDEALTNLEGLKGYNLRHHPPVRIKADEDDIPAEYYLFDVDQAKRDARRVEQPVYEEATRRGAEAVMAENNRGGAFDIGSPSAVAALAQNYRNLAKSVDWIADSLASALRAGVEDGETFDQLRDRVQASLGTTTAKSRVLARTEVGAAYNSGRFQEYTELGFKEVEWLTARDGDVRDSHAGLDGVRRKIGDAFPNGLMYPLDGNGPAREVVNCRCTMIGAGGFTDDD